MNFQEYLDYFKSIVDKSSSENEPSYNYSDYYDYTKLNWSRMNRWFKTGKLSAQLLEVINKIDKPQNWIVISKPWCVDAAHSVPFIEMAARENSLISASYELKDAEPFRIEQYHTNGTKSIPKLDVRIADGNDLGTLGPRPKDCQVLYSKLTLQKAAFETVKVELQNWYNTNKGTDIQKELIEIISNNQQF